MMAQIARPRFCEMVQELIMNELYGNVWIWISLIFSLVFVCIYAINRASAIRLHEDMIAVNRCNRTMLYDPIVIKNAEIDRKAEELAEAMNGLNFCYSIINVMKQQIKSSIVMNNKLQLLVEQFIQDDNDEKALDKLTDLERSQSELTINVQHFTMHCKMLDIYLNKICAVNNKITKLQQDAKQKGVRLKMGNFKEIITKLASKVGKENVNLENLTEINQEIEFMIGDNLKNEHHVYDVTDDELSKIEENQQIYRDAALDKFVDLKKKSKLV